MVARLATPLVGELPQAARRVASPTTTRPANPVLSGPGLVMCHYHAIPGNRGLTGTSFPTSQVGGAGTGSVPRAAFLACYRPKTFHMAPT